VLKTEDEQALLVEKSKKEEKEQRKSNQPGLARINPHWGLQQNFLD
jgi:hypothetical protein